jgi:hypothetical protein
LWCRTFGRPHVSHDEHLQVIEAIKKIACRIVGMDTEDMFADMGKTWELLTADWQLRWYDFVTQVFSLS